MPQTTKPQTNGGIRSLKLEAEAGFENQLNKDLAILIDAENTPHNMMKYILDASARYGRAIIKRAYGDWTTPNLQKWSKLFREYAIKPMQQYHFTTGKNSSDSAMIIDAMDILHKGNVDSFILVTSDSDFTGLAMRIREEGLTVIGIGRQTAPQSFVKGCEEFVLIESLAPIELDTKSVDKTVRTNSSKEARSHIDKPPMPSSHSIPLGTHSEGKELLIRAGKAAADENGVIKGAYLATVIRRLDPTFSPKNYGVKKLADFVDLFPDVILPTGKRTGTDPSYKLIEHAVT